MITNRKPEFSTAPPKEKIHHEINCEQEVTYSKISNSQDG